MSVRGSKRGKSSHEQRAVRGGGGGNLFAKAAKGITPVRGAAGGLLFLRAKGHPKKAARPGFEHASRRATFRK